MIAELVLVAVAALLWPGPELALVRVVGGVEHRRWLPSGEPRWLGQRTETDPFAVAAGYDLLAVCLRAGLPVATATAVAAGQCPEPMASGLARTAELLSLGATPEVAWALGDDADQHLRELATLAKRASRAGASLADGVAALAEATRENAATAALARAERAGVTISGPLGLCFLPAFVCLGIVPVVVGLAAGMFPQL